MILRRIGLGGLSLAIAVSGVVQLIQIVTPAYATSAEEWAPSNLTQVAAADAQSCAVADGKAYCWGANIYGALGNGTTTNSTVPVAVAGLLAGKTVSSVSTGGLQSCAVADGKAYCWGANTSGQLGDGTTSNNTLPVAVNTAGVLMGKTVTAISVGTEHVCAIADGGVYCWGRNNMGQLGNSATVNSLTPVAVDITGVLAGKTVSSVSAAQDNTCAIANARPYCWGDNYFGQLGNGTTTSSTVPVAVDATGVLAGKTVTGLSAMLYHGCALADGAVYCWGYNGGGQLGNGTTTNSSVPVAVDTSGVLAGKTITAMGVTSISTCAIANGGVYCWGQNYTGALGNGTTTNSSVPVAVDTSGVLAGKTITAMGTGWQHVCAMASGRVYCWGSDSLGQLGNGEVGTSHQSPVVVINALPPSEIASIGFSDSTNGQVLTVNGTSFPSAVEAIFRSLVSLNGEPIAMCAGGALLAALQSSPSYDPQYYTADRPCYYALDFENFTSIMTASEVMIWLPSGFDISAPGTVQVNGGPVYHFNTPTTPAPTGDEVPPVVLNTPETVLPTHIDRLLLAAAPLNRTDNNPVVDVLSKSEVSVDDKPMVGTPVISSLPVFRGKTAPYSTVIVTVHSDPVTCTTKADGDGNWECTLGTALPAGGHTVNIAVTTPDNVTTHLGPYPVRVATAGQSQPPVQDIAVSASETKAPGWSLPWSLVVAIVSIVIITLVVAIARRKRQRDNY